MKTYLSILAISLLAFSSCTSPQGAQSKVYSDDVYYSSKDEAADKIAKEHAEAKQLADQRAEEARERQEEANRQAEAANQRVIDAGRNTPVTDEYYTPSDKNATVINNTTNNYYDEPFNYDDYYDNEYAVRLRRFHNNCPSYGYYDNYYTNSYWYTGDPYTYGSSIYMGYNFWGPSYNNFAYNPGLCWYSNWGWNNDPWYNPYGYNPYGYGGGYGYGYGYGYGGYGGYGYNPYMNGYNNGYWDGYNANNYFNSFDNNSYYYGPRRTTGGNGRTSAQPTLASRMMDNMDIQAMATPADVRGNNQSRPVSSTINPTYINGVPANNYNEKPENNYSGKPAENKPSGLNPAFNSKPADNYGKGNPVYSTTPEKQQPVYNEKPVYNNGNNNNNNYERPVQIQQPKYEEKPREEPRPRETPRSEEPKNNGGFSPRSSPSPSSGGGGGSPRNSSSSKPRR